MRNILLAVSIFLFFNFSEAQEKMNAQDNLDKYWNYRTRLVNYFVKPGPKMGESVVAHIRNKNGKSQKGFSVSDQTIDLAWYIGILATEYRLLIDNNQNAESTLRELYYAMLAFDRLDRCETGPPWLLDKDTLDGFFIRYDTGLESKPEEFSIIGRNKGLSSKDTWGSKPAGVPTFIAGYDYEDSPNYHTSAVSQDQVVHLLMGYSLVYKCLPDTALFFYDNNLRKHRYNFHQNALNVVDRLISYFLKDSNWIIKDPKGDNVPRGHNAIMYAYPLAAIGKRVTGKSYDDTWSQSFWAKKLWGLSRVPNWVNDYNSTMALTLAALSDTWWDMTPFGKINNTGFYIKKCGGPWNRETFFLLLYQFINNKRTNKYDKEKVLAQIESAPFNGPYYWSQDSVKFDCCGMQAGRPGDGWAYPNKFRGTKKEQFGLDDNPHKGNFSGVDYLLLYNLYHLTENPIPYKGNLNVRK